MDGVEKHRQRLFGAEVLFGIDRLKLSRRQVLSQWHSLCQQFRLTALRVMLFQCATPSARQLTHTTL